MGTPVNFKITSDSIMNSFFIPQLGSQVYAMAGMETKLHLIANEAGTYDGMSANYGGGGFSGEVQGHCDVELRLRRMGGQGARI